MTRSLRPVAHLMCLLAGSLLLQACSPPGPALFPTRDPSTEDRAEPKVVSLNRSSAPPTATDIGSTDTMGVALRTPLGHDAALQLLSSFFDALIRENHSLLSKTTNGRASLHDLRPRARRTAYHAGHVWRGRFRKRSYEKLRDILVFRPSDVITYDRKSYQRLPRPLRQKAKPKLDNQDLVLQVPLLVHTLNGRRYLAEEMTFWLERQQGRYVITHIAEVFPF